MEWLHFAGRGVLATNHKTGVSFMYGGCYSALSAAKGMATRRAKWASGREEYTFRAVKMYGDGQEEA